MNNNSKYYGQFELPLDKYLHENFLLIPKMAYLLKLVHQMVFLKTINVDPLPDWYNELVLNRPNSININKCLHPYKNDGDVIFHIPCLTDYGYKNHLGSLNLNNLTKYNTHIKEITSKTITYNEIITKNNITRLDLFVLDIEGYEIEFLKSFSD